MSLNLIRRTLIDSFDEEHDFLSNFYKCEIVSDTGRIYPSVEHAYQAAKCDDENYKVAIANLPHYQASKAKRMGSKRGMKKLGVKIRDDWESIKIPIMIEFVRRKFSQEPLRSMLLDTAGYEIVEGNNWHDNVWGDCECVACEAFEGRNVMGRILMMIRGELGGITNEDQELYEMVRDYELSQMAGG